jgi:adenylate cyclase
VHTGRAFVGLVGSAGNEIEFTALGDAVNATARLASSAGAGEILISDTTSASAGFDPTGLEDRRLELRGRTEPIVVHVLDLARDASGRAVGGGSGRGRSARR